jgi:DNA-binding MarR family transcriptional regulator
MSDAFPADVKEFLGQNIHSVAQLEVLLMLRAESGRLWTAEDVAKILYVQPPMAKNMLTDLVQRGFVVQSEANFRYQPAGDRIGALIERVAELYRERRVAVTYEIYSKPMNVVQAFADAFRLRKEE